MCQWFGPSRCSEPCRPSAICLKGSKWLACCSASHHVQVTQSINRGHEQNTLRSSAQSLEPGVGSPAGRDTAEEAQAAGHLPGMPLHEQGSWQVLRGKLPASVEAKDKALCERRAANGEDSDFSTHAFLQKCQCQGQRSFSWPWAGA